jgi:hypothetical protein
MWLTADLRTTTPATAITMFQSMTALDSATLPHMETKNANRAYSPER